MDVRRSGVTPQTAEARLNAHGGQIEIEGHGGRTGSWRVIHRELCRTGQIGVIDHNMGECRRSGEDGHRKGCEEDTVSHDPTILHSLVSIGQIRTPEAMPALLDLQQPRSFPMLCAGPRWAGRQASH